MNWKFWKRDTTKDKEETIIKITKAKPASTTEIYVCAQSVEKAYDLYKKVRKENEP